MKEITSQPLVIVDQTDTRKLEVYIKSNMPTVQIFNVNSSGIDVYTPNWAEGDGLKLEADVFLDSRSMTTSEDEETSVTWYKDTETEANKITVQTDKKTIVIKENLLDQSKIVTYICKVKYQSIEASSRITFARVDTGRNGSNGADGTSVKILGTAKSVTKVPDTNYYTIEYDDGAIVAAALGDAYVYRTDGHLYVCASLNAEDGKSDYFVDAGPIQGAPGAPAKSLSLVGSSQVFRFGADGKIISPLFSTVTANCVNIANVQAIKWEYRYDNFGVWKVLNTISENEDISLSENSAIVAGEKLPSNVTSVSLRATFDTESEEAVFDIFTLYKSFDGTNGVNGSSAAIAFLTNENISLPALADGTISDIITFRTHVVAYRGEIKETPIIGAIRTLPDGMSVAPNKGTAYAQEELNVSNAVIANLYSDKDTEIAIDKTTLIDGDSFVVGDYLYYFNASENNFQSKVLTVDGVSYLDRIVSGNEIAIVFLVVAGTNLGTSGNVNDEIEIPVISPANTDLLLNWSKINAGPEGQPGVGINSVQVRYGISDSIDAMPNSEDEWLETIPEVPEGNYLWTRTIIDYTDPEKEDTVTYTYAKQGTSGQPGTSVKIESIEYKADSSATTEPETGWSKGIVSATSSQPYLWTKTTFSDGHVAYSVSRYGTDGGKGDKGDPGSAGADAYTVILTNESHVFAGDASNAIATSVQTQILAYKGTSPQPVTITSVNGVKAATAPTATGIAGLSFACSALSGTSPTITFTCTTAFVSPNGTIPIVLSVDGVSITKMFTYSIAFNGEASSSYWLVSNASAVQKTSSGDILCNPATLTFTGRSQTGTSTPTNYACRWIIATSTDGTTYTDAYTSTANEATKSFATSATYKSIRVRMYLAGGTTTLLDEQIIPFVSDGETGAVGATGDSAVTFQVYSNNGYALSVGTPTILLQTFAYFGDVEITAGATYQWYRHNGTSWVAVSNATNGYFNVSRDDVSFSNNYMCKMQFNDAEYVGVVTIDDKNDENKVFASKPNNYFSGDLWIVGTDYIPSGFTAGTMLRAEYSNSSYADSDWVSATKYDDEISDLKETVDEYKQYFSVDSANGLQVGDASINNNILTVETINTTTINAKEVEVESPLNVNGRYSGSTMLQAPTINLGNFSIVVESNGSLSFVVNT